MSKSKIGCIGCGNMGGALLAGLSKNQNYALYGYTRTMARMQPLIDAGVTPLANAKAIAKECRYVILGVKPYQIHDILTEIQDELTPESVIISIAAGISLQALQAAAPKSQVVRCMPNTPALVGAGIFAFCFGNSVQAENKETVLRFFSELGLCLEIAEARFTAFSALIGAGPAYLFDLMEGMVLAGVSMGFQHAESRRMVAALFAGCGKMALADEKTHLCGLRDNVCSPAGLTIAGLQAMQRDALAAKLAEAVFAANARGKEMES